MAAWGLRINDDRLQRLLVYARLLASYKRANVIGTRDLDRIIHSHLLDSLSCFLYEPLARAETFADVGSGGGLPGIPIKVVRPALTTTLVESAGKKVRFLEYALRELALNNVEVAHDRVEQLARTQAHREAYDVVTARAVARLSAVAEYCIPLLKVGGSAISMKGRLHRDELEEGTDAAETLGAKVSEIMPVSLPPEASVRERNLVIIEKVGPTPARYPRRPGIAIRRPLGVNRQRPASSC